MLRVGLDIGSTTIKCIVLNENDQIIYKSYERHYAKITDKTIEILERLEKNLDLDEIHFSISGTSGMNIAKTLDIPFIQEVYATRVAVKNKLPDTDVVIELGGEDAKIIFLSGYDEVRMNGSCAGGTGAFIDQMAVLLNVEPLEMEALAKNHQKIYPIASRCGVFAKSDIQPLLNQGVTKEDVAASIFYAVVNQTVAGLAQGRKIQGNVVYLGGPCTFFSELRNAFDDVLKTKGLCPENSLYFVAYGSALLCTDKVLTIKEILNKLNSQNKTTSYATCDVLFKDEAEYKIFKEKHPVITENIYEPNKNHENLYIGIDAGSTTLKMVAINENDEIVYSTYQFNHGNPIKIVLEQLKKIYQLFPEAKIKCSATTGYGEEMIQTAFGIDYGIVETVAHFTATKKFDPQVDFILDIGGQDIKCFKIHNQMIDSIFLNEACSSGCGSFLQTFSESMGYSIEEFAKLGLFAKKPVDLGSRCTVFMNSKVKQAQKEGVKIADISAGLSISVVKNALYKVIRINKNQKLGDHIWVQGGTFLNDAVLKAFENEIHQKVHRSSISGLMGAYGAALYAKEHVKEKSNILSLDELQSFKHTIRSTICQGCTNHCQLTINSFGDNRVFIGGNQCNKMTKNKHVKNCKNMYDFKKALLSKYKSFEGQYETIGLPIGLNMYELLPFWYTIFKDLNFGICTSHKSNKVLFHKGQATIASDTICYPAKLMNGHIADLVEQNVKNIFYPCLSYNFDEKHGDNHYNCPVVAYYPEVIYNNFEWDDQTRFLHPYFGIHRPKDFANHFLEFLNSNFKHNFTKKQVEKAVEHGYSAYHEHLETIKNKGEEYLNYGIEHNLPIYVLCGRPYHLDEEINHGLDHLLETEEAVILSEDSLGKVANEKVPTDVLNQWTYHARMYGAANYIANLDYSKINLIQLVSFGCGLDAITSDEIRAILESKGKIYTQIKMDEITNMGAVKIRLRSLVETTKQKEA